MVVGVLQVEVLIPGSESLKDKRRVLRSVKDRLSRRLHVSVAEIGAREILNRAVVGIGVVGGEGRVVGEVLDHAVEMLRSLHDAEVIATERVVTPHEVMHVTEESDFGGLEAEMLARAEEVD